jgi:hypothetical protein
MYRVEFAIAACNRVAYSVGKCLFRRPHNTTKEFITARRLTRWG